MGLMKRYLMERIAEYARKSGLTEEEIYDDTKYALAVEYASECLKECVSKNEPDAQLVQPPY